MPQQTFQFDVYRLNIVDNGDLFEFMGGQITSDEDLVAILSESTKGRFDVPVSGKRAIYRWTLREFVDYDDTERGRIVRLTLVRLILEQSGLTVTDAGLEETVSELSPPLGLSLHLFFYMSRHLVAAEYNSALMGTNAWLKSVHQILDDAAKSKEFRSQIRLEPVPKHAEILSAFRSLDRLTRLRVHLLLPNPDLSRYTKHLFEDMKNGGIREFLQDMRNPTGLSKDENAMPFAAASMAQAGYKKGEVTLESTINRKRSVIRTGRRAVRASLDQVRDFARGIGANARSKEAQAAAAAIIAEIDRLVEPHTNDGA